MQLKHIALVCSSEEGSDRFYMNLLGLKKMSSKTIPAELSKQIFNLDYELKIINYANENIHFEIFIDNHKGSKTGRIDHVCLQVDDLESFLKTCRAMALEILRVPKGDAFITFIKDYDGNLFEITPA